METSNMNGECLITIRTPVKLIHNSSLMYLTETVCLLLNTETHLIYGNNVKSEPSLTLKAPITTAADDSHNFFFNVFQRK